jgi:hypothetical protein
MPIREIFDVPPGIIEGATGDLYYRATNGDLTAIPIGTESQALTVSSGLPTWGAAGGGAAVEAGDGLTASTASGTATLSLSTAVSGAEYVVAAASTALSAERVLTAGTGVTISTATSGLIILSAAGGAGPGGTVPDWVAYDPRTVAPAGANDDEFTAGSLDADWTESITGSVTRDFASTHPSHIYVRLDGSTSFWGITRAAPTGTGTFGASILVSAAPFQTLGAHQVLLYAQDSGGTNAVYAKWSAGNLYLMTQDSGSFTDRFLSNLGWFTQIYIQIQRYASNVWRVWYSTDGRAWHAVGGNTHTKSFTVDKIGIQFGASSATIYGSGLRHALDFYREDWLAL